MAGGPPGDLAISGSRRPLPRAARIALAAVAFGWTAAVCTPFLSAALAWETGLTGALLPLRAPATVILVASLVGADVWRRGGSLRAWGRDVLWNRRVAVEALVVALFLATLPLWARTFLSYAFLFPWKEYLAVPEAHGLPREDASIPREDGAPLTGWYIPANEGTRPRAAVLVSNGNAANMSQLLDHASLLHDLGCAVLLYDYQGFGRSPGRRDIGSLAEDARAAARWLRERVPDAPQVSFGISLGTQPAARLAAEHLCDALILEGAFQPRDELAHRFRYLPPLVWALRTGIPEELDLAGNLAAAHPVPVLFLHGTDDTITPLTGARRLFEGAGTAARWTEFPATGHLEPILRLRDYRASIAGFLDEALATTR